MLIVVETYDSHFSYWNARLNAVCLSNRNIGMRHQPKLPVSHTISMNKVVLEMMEIAMHAECHLDWLVKVCLRWNGFVPVLSTNRIYRSHTQHRWTRLCLKWWKLQCTSNATLIGWWKCDLNEMNFQPHTNRVIIYVIIYVIIFMSLFVMFPPTEIIGLTHNTDQQDCAWNDGNCYARLMTPWLVGESVTSMKWICTGFVHQPKLPVSHTTPTNKVEFEMMEIAMHV